MNNQFDDLTKSLAQSVTRRAAMKKFAVGLAGMALACVGMPNKARAANTIGEPCKQNRDCQSPLICCKRQGFPQVCNYAAYCHFWLP